MVDPLQNPVWHALGGPQAVFAEAKGRARRFHPDVSVFGALPDTPDADDTRWLSAALLHDIGKLDSRLGVYGRVVATVSGAAVGREHAAAWSESTGFTRRVGLYLRHAELGADRIRLAGEPEEAARWAAAHHDPSTWPDLPIPSEVVVALDQADND